MRRAILFDLDGTLVDTADDLARALNSALGLLGRPAVAANDVRGMIGGGIEMESEKGVGSRFTVRLPAHTPSEDA